MSAAAPPRRILILGRGRMGRLIESLSPEYGFTVAGSVDIDNAGRDDWPGADVAIDFSIPEAVPVNFPKLAARGLSVVIGTTGWAAHESAIRELAARHRIGVVAAPNFALGVNLFNLIVARRGHPLKERIK